VGLKRKATLLSKQQRKGSRWGDYQHPVRARGKESDDGYNNNVVHFITHYNKVRKSSEKKHLVTEVEFEREGMWRSSGDTV